LIPGAPAATAPERFGDTSFLGHPRGLAYLAFTEGWERFSFFGMQTLLVLYMVGWLFKPGRVEHVLGLAALRGALEGVFGPLSPQALASLVFGGYSGLAYFLPVFGGLLGDRVLGQHRMVMTGAVLMACGHFLMAFEPPFLLALVLLVLGSGCLKGNIATQVGSLYSLDDRRRSDAFQIFSIGINVGVVSAPFVCGTLGELLGWHWGFAAAGVGMLIGLSIYVSGRRHLPPDRHLAWRRGERPKLVAGDGRVIVALLVVLVVVTCFLIPGGQIGNVYPLWVKAHVDRSVFGFTIPVTWFQSMTAIVLVLFPAAMLRFWQWQARGGREPGPVTKLGWGCFVSVLAYGLLAALSGMAAGDSQVGCGGLFGFHFLYGIGYLFVWPVGMSLFATASPRAVSSMFVGIYYTSVFFANNLVGWVGSFYERMTPESFWTLQVGFVALGVLIVLAFGSRLEKALAPRPALETSP
jgi:POT family proton-dependent oligopeptide transporter